MTDKLIFVDSNILLYLFGDDNLKKDFALSLMSSRHTISVQVVNENVNVCLRKLRLPKEVAFQHGLTLMTVFQVVPLTELIVQTAMRFSQKYNLSYWDSLVVAAAYENNCTVLLTEDMHNGLVVEGRLTIKNPY